MSELRYRYVKESLRLQPVRGLNQRPAKSNSLLSRTGSPSSTGMRLELIHECLIPRIIYWTGIINTAASLIDFLRFKRNYRLYKILSGDTIGWWHWRRNWSANPSLHWGTSDAIMVENYHARVLHRSKLPLESSIKCFSARSNDGTCNDDATTRATPIRLLFLDDILSTCYHPFTYVSFLATLSLLGYWSCRGLNIHRSRWTKNWRMNDQKLLAKDL